MEPGSWDCLRIEDKPPEKADIEQKTIEAILEQQYKIDQLKINISKRKPIITGMKVQKNYIP